MKRQGIAELLGFFGHTRAERDMSSERRKPVDLVRASAMVAGLNILADAVKVTLGPKGHHVVLAYPFGAR